MKEKILLKFVSVLALSFSFFFLGTGEIEASEKGSITKEEFNQQMQNFIDMGIDKKTAKKLTEKVARGELLDAQKESEIKKLDDEALSVDIEVQEKFIEFEDGSRIQLSLEEEEPLFTTFDYATGTVTNNSCTTGSGYKNCNVTARYQDGVWDVRFNAVVSQVQGGYDSISSISRQAVDAVFYSVTQKKFAIVRSKETSSAAALAEYTNQFSHKTGLYTISRTLSLYAKGDKTYARLNYY